VREPGFKYNLPDIAAALGIVQLKKLDIMQQRRHEIAQHYIDALEELPGIRVQGAANGERDRHAWCMFVIRVDERAAGISRDDLIEELKARNIGTSVHYIPTHMFSGYRHLRSDHLAATQRAGQQILSLPLYPTMRDDDVDDVIDAIKASLMSRKQADAALAG
jgi:UDP-4-amino-4-deoxy-L-arabinose-oxoglutarate aminotransferase